MKNFILSILLIVTGCSIVPSERKTAKPASGRETVDEISMEKDLAASVDLYLKKTGFNEMAETVSLNTSFSRPVIAATKEELKRLRSAWKNPGPERKVLAARFERADQAIEAGLTFPPEGGQHNQWYQCDSCQRGLVTVDEHHHQCPSCRRMFSGFPYDNVLYNRKHSRNIQSAEDAAWAWIITGEKKYAEHAASVLEGYAERYLKYPMISASVSDKSIDIAAGKNGKYRSAGHMQPQTLDESGTLVSASIAYDLIYNSGVLDAEKKMKIENDLLRAMAGSINIYKAGKSNWQTWHNAALLYSGAVLGDGNLIREALLDNKNGFTAQLKMGVLPEGMWYENSWGYHYYTLSAMTHIAEGSRRLGIDIYSFPALKKMYLIAFDYLMADGSLPRFGDAVQDSPMGRNVNEKAYAVYRDERLISALSTEPDWDAIMAGRKNNAETTAQASRSKLIPGSGHGILATNGPGKLTAAISFGPYGGFHGHFDKNSFVFFGFGEELGVDPGRAASQAYRLPVHKEWYKASTGHNVILADGRSQNEAEGKCLAFAASDSYAAITTDAGPVYNDISHVRFLLLTPGYLLIVDELNSSDGNDHVFDWLYHNKGQAVTCDLPTSDSLPGALPAGYSYMKDILAFRDNGLKQTVLRFTGDKTSVNMIMAQQPDDLIFTATGPLKSIDDKVPMVIVRRKGRKLRFITLLEPVLNSDGPKVKSLTMESCQSSAVTAIVDNNGEEERISFPSGTLDKFRVDKIINNGSRLLLQN